MSVYFGVRTLVLKDLRGQLGDRVLEEPVLQAVIREFGPLSIEETSLMLGVSKAATRSVESRAIKALANKFPELQQELPRDNEFDPRQFIG